MDFDVVNAPADAIVATAMQCEPCLVDGNCVVGACQGGLCRFDTEIVIDCFADCRIGTDPVSSWTLRATNLRAGQYTITAIPSACSFGPGLTTPWRFNPFCGSLDLSPIGTLGYTTASAAEAAVSTTPIVQTFAGGDLRCASLDSACGDNSGLTRFMVADSCP